MPVLFIPTPTPTPVPLTGKQVTDVIDAIDRTANTFQDFTIGLAALFILGLFLIMIIVYLYSNRNASKGAQEMMTTFAQAMGTTLKERDERIDALESEKAKREDKYNEGVMFIGDGLNRIADVVTLLQKHESERDRVLSDATSAMTAIVTVGSKPLQQVVKDMSALQKQNADIQTAVSKLYDRFLLVFPAEEVHIDQVREALIKTVNTVCEMKKHDTGELPPLKDIVKDTPAESAGLGEVA